MRTTTASSLFTLLSISTLAVGCAATVPGPTDEDPTDPTNPDDDQPVPLSPQGKFAMSSEFDLATNMPGTTGEVVGVFIGATDDPDDPTRFIVEQLVNALPNGSVKDNLRDAIPFVSGYLNDRLLDWAPDLVTKVVDMGNGFGQIAKHFGTIGVLDIAADGKAKHVVNGFHFKVDNVELDFPFEDYALSPLVVDTTVTLSQTGKLEVAAHTIPVSYGTALRLGLDEVVIPLIDPSATTVTDVLVNAIDCESVGQKVYDAVGFGSASTFESACNAGLRAGGTFIYQQIDRLDGSAIDLGIAGVARGVDRDKNGSMDDIQTGTWSGTLTYAGSPVELPMGAKFRGSRM